MPEVPPAGVSLLLVVNPNSRAARKGRVAPVRQALVTQGYDVEVATSQSGADLEHIVAASQPGQIVAALGGDGTIALAARGAYRSGAILLPLPGGRGNDLCDWLGIGTDPVVAARRVSAYTVQQLDAATANGELFIGVATIGFDSLANRYANEMRVIKGKSVYIAGGAKALAKWRGAEFPLRIDGEEVDARGMSVTIGNSGQYGGGIKICPRAVMDDGLLDVLVAGEVSKPGYVAMLPKLQAGTHLDHPQVRYLRGRRIEIGVPQSTNPKLQGEIVLYADGDPVASPPITIEVVPRAVRVLAPPAR
ncbi:hypothetical protein EK0264_13715 [Epidermidibacterium keratini]|uniref:DAGKc domain-containing protein n=1 Tax=Epidermidibacterium keratini TaxID=1891644 RepID=A0A7L4YPN8_9ACTN|nr:diacylglycerol kinase family protein [Epidermidibacterium keratini]QHC01241.1 hypothetical protein EK0264_13715 [Epidermidibacterium keratini]